MSGALARHPGEGRGPAMLARRPVHWIPASAGMTV